MSEMPNDDLILLRDYARHNSEDAFATLVSRYVNLVYSVALRQVCDPQLAEEITQAVFVILARKADSLGDKTILSGWLCRTARYASANVLTLQRRRERREHEAFMQSQFDQPPSGPPHQSASATGETWSRIAPLLDRALEQLGRKDHDAVVLRFFEGRNFRDVGAALGASEDAAKMRVSRALEKLRKFFSKRGVSSTAAVIAGAISAHSVQAAPVALAKSVTAVAVVKGAAASTSTLAIIQGALKLMAWAQAKTAMTAGMGALLAIGLTGWLMHGRPATPHLSLAASFGPVHEMSLDNSGNATFLDLDGARLLSDYPGARSDFGNWAKQNGVDIALPKFVTGKGGVGHYELNGAAVVLPEAAAPKEGVCSFDLKCARYHNYSWNEMSAAEIRQEFSELAPRLEAATNNFVLSGTYLFQTREGSVGIMQINLYTAYPRSMKIRYKLVQPNN